jgi:hypothetical protein
VNKCHSREEGALIEVLEKCTRQFVLNASRNAKFLSSLQATDLCFAKIASRNTKDFKSV